LRAGRPRPPRRARSPARPSREPAARRQAPPTTNRARVRQRSVPGRPAARRPRRRGAPTPPGPARGSPHRARRPAPPALHRRLPVPGIVAGERTAIPACTPARCRRAISAGSSTARRCSSTRASTAAARDPERAVAAGGAELALGAELDLFLDGGTAATRPPCAVLTPAGHYALGVTRRLTCAVSGPRSNRTVLRSTVHAPPAEELFERRAVEGRPRRRRKVRQ
jgi:hypothetical protein